MLRWWGGPAHQATGQVQGGGVEISGRRGGDVLQGLHLRIATHLVRYYLAALRSPGGAEGMSSRVCT